MLTQLKHNRRALREGAARTRSVTGDEGVSVADARWLILVHQLPPKPDYLRVKVRRRLQRLGAVLFKNSVYVLPATEETLEDFVWLINEILTDGGEASVFAASLLEGVSDEDVEELFRVDRNADYRRLADEASDTTSPATADRLARLRRKFDEIERLDWFSAPARVEAERALQALEGRNAGRSVGSEATPVSADRPRGATWVTRSGVFVDRIASAWLIRRFIDPKATFRFVSPRAYRPERGELRFDMAGGEYTHEGERCTFETLVARFGLEDPALRIIAEIVHDIDLKDEKFGRPEAPGIASLLGGLARAEADDAARLRQGTAIFDGLYAQFAR